jgi:hypothetical protein
MADQDQECAAQTFVLAVSPLLPSSVSSFGTLIALSRCRE